MLTVESTSKPRSLLSKTWLPVCVLAIAIYIILQALIQCDILYSHFSLCHNEEIPTFLWLMQCLSAMSFFIKVLLMCLKWIVAGRKIRGASIDLTSIFGTSFTTSFITGSSSFLAAGWNWGGICNDQFGNETIFAFTFLNLFVKLVFITLNMECHIETLYETFQTKQDQANQSRQAFLRYIMHEVRVPLSSISMGIDALSSLEEGYNNTNNTNNINTSTNTNNTENGYASSSSSGDSSLQKDAEDQETLFIMREAVSFMSDTLNSILNMQKIEEGKLNLVYSKFIIKDLIRKVCCTLRGILSSKLISLQVNISDDVAPCLIGDSFQIEHVLANFLSNAIKFSPVGSCVHIEVTNDDTQGSNHVASSIQIPRKTGHMMVMETVDYIVVKFAVRDEGVGISEEDQRKLFKPFSQIRPGELQGGGGSGVGLSICKQIIELHGGTVGCTSVPNGGSVFFFILPLSINNADALVPSSPVPTPVCISVPVPVPLPVDDNWGSCKTVSLTNPSVDRRQSSDRVSNRVSNGDRDRYGDKNKNKDKGSVVVRYRRKLLQRKYSSIRSIDQKFLSCPRETMAINDDDDDVFRALVVDDVHSNRKLLTLLLRKKHVDCSEVEDGADAVAFVKASPDMCDMIFMDNMMPKMTGIIATNCIRGLGYDKLIIGLTGNAMDDDVNEFLAAGVDVVFTKPMRMEQLHMLFAYINTNGNGTVGKQKLRIVGNELIRIFVLNFEFLEEFCFKHELMNEEILEKINFTKLFGQYQVGEDSVGKV
eukprot:gene2616-5113_t